MTERSDHTGYIRAVTTRLVEEEVRVSASRVGTTDGLRWAELDLEPEDCPRLDPNRGERYAVASWDEEQGWCISVALQDGERSPGYLHGLHVLPHPTTAALWVLGHTLEDYPSREDGPFRQRTDHTPELEEDLASFT